MREGNYNSSIFDLNIKQHMIMWLISKLDHRGKCKIIQLIKSQLMVEDLKRHIKIDSNTVYDSPQTYLKHIKARSVGNYKNITDEITKPTSKEKFQYTFGDETAQRKNND